MMRSEVELFGISIGFVVLSIISLWFFGLLGWYWRSTACITMWVYASGKDLWLCRIRVVFADVV